MKRRRRPPAQLHVRRDAALEAVPYQVPPVRQERKDGKLYVTIEFIRPRWQRVLGADETCTRTFGLDAHGQYVYKECDGEKPVRKIIDRFTRHARVSRPEAEMAVTKFMKTLIGKGLIAMQMEKPSP